MCGRITLAVSTAEVAELFTLLSWTAELPPRYNIAPTQPLAAIYIEGASPESTTPPTRKLDYFFWGLIPHWSRDARAAAALINARAETVESKPAFRQAFKRRRCIIPASGFYEWPKNAKAKTGPFYIRPRKDPLFAFAGLWESWHDPSGNGSEIRSCCVITVPANSALSTFHDRMPAILRRDDFATWLDPRNEDEDVCKALLQTRGPEEIEIVPVSAFVNSPKNEGVRCIQQAEPEALLF